MSIKKFNANEDIFSNEYYEKELINFGSYYFSGSNDGSTNYKLANHYVHQGVSGSWYLEVFDNDVAMPSSNRLACISFGYTTSSSYFSQSNRQNSNKFRMYRLFAKKLLGSEDLIFKSKENKEIHNAVFISIPRNHFRDEVSISNTDVAEVAIWYHGEPGTQTAQTSSYYINENYFYSFSGKAYSDDLNFGLLFPKAGVFVLDAEKIDSFSYNISGTLKFSDLIRGVSGTISSSYNDLLWSIKHKIAYMYFTAQNKTCCSFYKCTAMPDEFNYSSNPSFVGPNQEILTALSATTPTVYFSQVALMDDNGETVAVAKIKKPIKKHPGVGVTITARLDY